MTIVSGMEQLGKNGRDKGRVSSARQGAGWAEHVENIVQTSLGRHLVRPC